MAQIDYYVFTLSPFCYLAGTKMEEIAARHGAAIRYRPFALQKVFEMTGTKPVGERHPSRQRYRLQEMRRIAKLEGLPINLQPRYWPTNPVPSSAAIIAAQEAGGGDLGGLVHGFLRACWAEDRDIAEDAVVREILSVHGFDSKLADSGLVKGVETYERNSQAALDAGVFGAPTYVVGEELFWGQDRLSHLDAHFAGRL
ncbi:MAG TPA: 2-hydroxychromene-2-carboxylate isomerase [Paracoccaceae bacterium]|nr:2-hydroxychromene-2-carboxylate isomerase [Paracoccaceae bacterium]